MNRSEFLMALYDALNDIPKQERTDAVSEYQEYFKNEMEKGLIEEEICLSLGDPVTLAYAIKQRRGYGQFTERPSHRRARPSGFFKLAKIITGVVIGMTILSVLGMSFSFSKGFSLKNLSFGIGDKYDIDLEKDIDLGSADTIIIKTFSATSEIKTSNSFNIHASLEGSVRTTNPDNLPTLEVSKSGNTIIVEEKRKTDNFLGSISSNLWLDVNIPESFHGEIRCEGHSGNFIASHLELSNFKLDQFSGNIDLDDIILNNGLELSSTSGNIKINKLKAKEASVKSTSGNKDFYDLYVSGNIQISSTSGKITIKDTNCNELILDSTSGTVRVEKSQIENASIKSLSGNVTVDELSGGAAIEATSGNINVSFSDVKNKIAISAFSGNIRLEIPDKSDFRLESKATSGNIRCGFDLADASSGKKSLSGRHGSGNIPISLSTTSGNINIDKR